MSTLTGVSMGTVELTPLEQSRPVIDELSRILALVRKASPRDATISFDFDGQLHVHIDVRRREEVTQLESVLPGLGGGLFHSLVRGATPHHPFFHRLSALVAT